MCMHNSHAQDLELGHGINDMYFGKSPINKVKSPSFHPPHYLLICMA